MEQVEAWLLEVSSQCSSNWMSLEIEFGLTAAVLSLCMDAQTENLYQFRNIYSLYLYQIYLV